MAYAIVVTGPLLLFNPWFVSLQQARHDVPERLGVSQGVVDAMTGEILADLFLGGDFDVGPRGGEPLLDDFERSHMQDVGSLVRTLTYIDVAALAVALAFGLWLRTERHRRGRLLIASAGVVGAAAVVLALVFAVAFDAAFLAFHRLFFREGTYLFGPGSDLIRLFPEPFWFEASLAAGVAVALTAAAVALVGARGLRAA